MSLGLAMLYCNVCALESMPLARAFALPAPRGSLDNIGSSRGDATPPLGWWGGVTLGSVGLVGTPLRRPKKPPHYATALNPIPAGAPFLQAAP